MKENIIIEKSKTFALKIIKAYQYLSQNKKEHVMSNQLLRAATSIGANIYEAVRGVSKPDFYNKMNIALKEANETDYWLELLCESNYLGKTMFDELYYDCQELIKILVAITKTQKNE